MVRKTFVVPCVGEDWIKKTLFFAYIANLLFLFHLLYKYMIASVHRGIFIHTDCLLFLGMEVTAVVDVGNGVKFHYTFDLCRLKYFLNFLLIFLI